MQLDELMTARRQVPQINVSALVDVIFTLLIFLLLAATFSRVGWLDVSLPKADAAHSTAKHGLVLIVPADGPVIVDGLEIGEERILSTLTKERAHHESLRLVADHAVALQRAVTILELAGMAGFTSVTIATTGSGID